MRASTPASPLTARSPQARRCPKRVPYSHIPSYNPHSACLVTKEAVVPPPSTDVKAETPRGLTAHPDPHDFRLTAPACARGPVNHPAVSHRLPTIYCGVLVNFTFRKYERSAHWCLMTSLRYHFKKTFFFHMKS